MLVCDEVGYIPFDPQAANLMFMLVSRRYERASLIVTSNKPFSAWGEIFGDGPERRPDLQQVVGELAVPAGPSALFGLAASSSARSPA